MTKQYRQYKKYVTLQDENGYDFRTISKIMTNAGFKMNHATVRNILLSSMETLLSHMSNTYKNKITKNDLKKLIDDQEVHDDFVDVLYLAYQELQNESKDKE